MWTLVVLLVHSQLNHPLFRTREGAGEGGVWGRKEGRKEGRKGGREGGREIKQEKTRKSKEEKCKLLSLWPLGILSVSAHWFCQWLSCFLQTLDIHFP